MQEIPRPEHPNPQVFRAEWLNLNGIWEFAETDDTADTRYLSAESYPDRINVPFCRESRLSGLGRVGFVKNVWYRRRFELPAGWKSLRTRLHIGACDWETTVWVNGHKIGKHTGGNAPFAFDITGALQPGSNTIIIHAFDDTVSRKQALGKQSNRLESYGCLYTRTTGIWQTVWLEGVGSSYLSDFHLQPDPAHSRVFIQAEVDGPSDDLTVKAEAYAGDKLVGSAETPADWRNGRMVVDLSEKRIWSPDNPFLYDLKLTLKRGEDIIDRVDSYFGLRDITIKGAAILINGKPIFQRLVLDQGFYPDGIWTAPSEAALKKDIELSMAVGFNGARLHQKVFEPRFLYWADKLGYLVWGEYPNWGMDHTSGAAGFVMTEEWTDIVRRDRNHPSIIGWCPFNETGADAGLLQNAVIAATRVMDPSRPVLDTSGYVHSLQNPEMMDCHDYDQNPETFRARYMSVDLPDRYRGISKGLGQVPFFVSEYGGIGWHAEGGWGYGSIPQSLDEWYTRYKGLTDALLDNRFMFAFCYTQLTDVEQEKNGIYTYQRESKFDTAKLHAINSRTAAYEKDPPVETGSKPKANWKVLVGAVPDGSLAGNWKYTMQKPAENWQSVSFDDAGWAVGEGGFGQKGGWEWATRTPWNTQDIWLRQEFMCDSTDIAEAMLVIHFDDDTEVFVNGTPVWSASRWNDRYDGFNVTEALKKSLKPGRNMLAVHCSQRNGGGQFIDLALLVR